MTPRSDFWMKCGVGRGPLRKLFPDLYSIVYVKDVSVAIHLDISSSSLH